MKAIIVDDEPLMIRSFVRASEGISEIELVGRFDDSFDALDFARNTKLDIAFLDIEMPEMSGLELADKLKIINPDTMIVFVTAYDKYIKQSNEMMAEYYLKKPYKKETVAAVAKRLSRLVPERKEKSVFIHCFGHFTVYHNGKPVPLVGKAKEIFALVTSQKGNEISNESLYTTIWEDRIIDNHHMKVYYNALTRLKKLLKEQGLSDILISTTRGQIINRDLVECDYFEYLSGNTRYRFEGEFLSDYSWAEEILAGLLNLQED